jgi:hypothetical protein
MEYNAVTEPQSIELALSEIRMVCMKQVRSGITCFVQLPFQWPYVGKRHDNDQQLSWGLSPR